MHDTAFQCTCNRAPTACICGQDMGGIIWDQPANFVGDIMYVYCATVRCFYNAIFSDILPIDTP